MKPNLDVELENALLRVKLSLGDTEVPAAIYAAGSVTRGWGNKNSDLDIFVVTSNIHSQSNDKFAAVALTLPSIRIRTLEGDRRLDLEFWTPDQVDQLLGKFEGIDVFDSPQLTPRELGLLTKFSTGQALTSPAWLRTAQERLADSHFLTVISNALLNEGEGYIEDATGQLDAGHSECAVLSAQFAYEKTIDAFIASRGELVTGRGKWRPKLLRAVSDDENLYSTYWNIVTHARLHPGRPTQWVNSVLEECQHLTLSISHRTTNDGGNR
ncbi:nucleotidyltransferase domain-containing protein [Paenarthrobacter aurescens]|uniref:nucleotidyltransferase domain-containing protein n=1 Tax=Paenarthrobacter aurescens TaxID=43663 RepID=UPI00131ED594|nr:nucleotidyltransferase domain-containing protein [Paenarthrobacter aurescens]